MFCLAVPIRYMQLSDPRRGIPQAVREDVTLETGFWRARLEMTYTLALCAISVFGCSYRLFPAIPLASDDTDTCFFVEFHCSLSPLGSAENRSAGTGVSVDTFLPQQEHLTELDAQALLRPTSNRPPGLHR